MKVQVLGSSSEGNCYLLESSGDILVIECGVQFASVKKALNFDLSRVVGCIVTHEHRDHSRSLLDFQKYGINTFAVRQVYESHNVSTRAFCNEIQPLKRYKIGDFTVTTLPAFHDVPCLAFVISHKEMGNMLFATDTMMLEHRVKGLNHVFIECNYCDEHLQRSIDEGHVPASMRPRLMQTHMELKTTIKTLKANDLSDVSEIVLLHLSNNNSDADRFQSEVEKATGKPTVIAKAGIEIELSDKPF